MCIPPNICINGIMIPMIYFQKYLDSVFILILCLLNVFPRVSLPSLQHIYCSHNDFCLRINYQYLQLFYNSSIIKLILICFYKTSQSVIIVSHQTAEIYGLPKQVVLLKHLYSICLIKQTFVSYNFYETFS